jgi:putative DNA primase/helicase
VSYLYNNIPSKLKTQKNWVVWGIRGSPEKSPFNPESLLCGRLAPAKAGIKETWGSYENAVKCVRKGLALGIGYEFDGSLYGVDLDNVIDDKGALMPQAKEIVGKLDSYTEISPSGKGLHIYVFAHDADTKRHRTKEGFLEIYNEGRYFTVTGNVYGSRNTIENRSQELQSIHDEFLFREKSKDLITKLAYIPMQSNEKEKFLQMGLSRDKVFQALWAGERKSSDESAGDMALMNKLAYWCNADPESMIQAFLKSPYFAQKNEAHQKKCNRLDYLPNTAQKACDTAYSTAAADYIRWQNKNQERNNSR